MQKMISGVAQVVDFNGSAFQYMTKPLPIAVGKPVRVFVVNAGPSHFMQTLFDSPGGGVVGDFTVLQAGSYAFVTHAFGDANAGVMECLRGSSPYFPLPGDPRSATKS
jgi:hypothetical protein